ncbi:hypothetical protein STEG23_004671, partial [Scotinomys teguina]
MLDVGQSWYQAPLWAPDIGGNIKFDSFLASVPPGDFAFCSRALSFDLVDLCIGESGVLKSPTINVWDLIVLEKPERGLLLSQTRNHFPEDPVKAQSYNQLLGCAVGNTFTHVQKIRDETVGMETPSDPGLSSMIFLETVITA